MNKVNVQALFLGPKSENQKYFKEMLNFMMDEHIHWRRNFHPDDPAGSLVPAQADLHAVVLAALSGPYELGHPHGRESGLHGDHPLQPEQRGL
jgi:hypothetical protein